MKPRTNFAVALMVVGGFFMTLAGFGLLVCYAIGLPIYTVGFFWPRQR